MPPQPVAIWVKAPAVGPNIVVNLTYFSRIHMTNVGAAYIVTAESDWKPPLSTSSTVLFQGTLATATTFYNGELAALGVT